MLFSVWLTIKRSRYGNRAGDIKIGSMDHHGLVTAVCKDLGIAVIAIILNGLGFRPTDQRNSRTITKAIENL